MFVAKKDFKTYSKGLVKKGQECEGKQAWIDAGLVEEKPEKAEKETKPEPKKKKSTK